MILFTVCIYSPLCRYVQIWSIRLHTNRVKNQQFHPSDFILCFLLHGKYAVCQVVSKDKAVLQAPGARIATSNPKEPCLCRNVSWCHGKSFDRCPSVPIHLQYPSIDFSPDLCIDTFCLPVYLPIYLSHPISFYSPIHPITSYLILSPYSSIDTHAIAVILGLKQSVEKKSKDPSSRGPSEVSDWSV